MKISKKSLLNRGFELVLQEGIEESYEKKILDKIVVADFRGEKLIQICQGFNLAEGLDFEDELDDYLNHMK